MPGFASFGLDDPVLQTPAVWHPGPAVSRTGYAVVLFRRAIRLRRPARRTSLQVSASQRFEFYLDGQRMARGPSRSDPLRWGVVRVALPPLPAGRHTLAVRVWHLGECAGLGQMGGPAFLLVSGAVGGCDVSTGAGWRCAADPSREPIRRHAWGARGFTYVVGCGELIHGDRVPWGWETAGFDDTAWPPAAVVCRGAACPWGNLPLGHVLRPDPLPAMRERVRRFARVADGGGADAEAWRRGARPLVVPPRTRLRLVLDMGGIVNGYTRLTVSGGQGSRVRLVSAEAPYTGDALAKAHRDHPEGMHIWGQSDELRPDGGAGRVFSTLWFRSFRYLELTLRTGAQALRLDDVDVETTGFPLRLQARFESDAAHRAAYARLWTVTQRTAELCAHETFFDCPHFEQMQFPGDTRVQAVYHYLAAGEDRLARKAIDDFHGSQLPSGLTACKFPSRKLQILPTYALYWVGMLYDALLYRGDTAFLAPYMAGARAALGWFARRARPDGLLGSIEFAPFTDWAQGFTCGNAPQDPDGGSSILTLLYAEALQWLARLEESAGMPELAPRWRRMAAAARCAAMRRCQDASRRLLADTPARKSFSVHAQVQAILAGALAGAGGRRALARALSADDVTQPGTFYYRYYVAQAMKAVGWRDGLFTLLPLWEKALDGTGLETWPESSGAETRSDCHAWSVTPGIEVLQTVLGVEPDPAVDGFGRILFQPCLGPLASASGRVPTPAGDVLVRLARGDGRIEADVESPVPVRVPGRPGILKPGRHRLAMAPGPRLQAHSGEGHARTPVPFRPGLRIADAPAPRNASPYGQFSRLAAEL